MGDYGEMLLRSREVGEVGRKDDKVEPENVQCTATGIGTILQVRTLTLRGLAYL